MNRRVKIYEFSRFRRAYHKRAPSKETNHACGRNHKGEQQLVFDMQAR